MKRLSITLATLVPLAFLAAPLSAQEQSQGEQDGGGEKVNQVIVFGGDPCPQSTGDEITVCARKDESERYRIPEVLREVENPRNDAWNNKVLSYETVGAAGTLSCSPVGPGGSLGCTQRLVDAAYAERGNDPGLRFSELIAAERERRLSTIDEQAAETQRRVEEAERQYEERQRREGEGAGSSARTP